MALIENHALIGDRHSAALVCNDGTIDWLCLPRFDSPACFAALLGTRDNGHWRIAPEAPAQITRHYRGDSMVLETRFETADGDIALIDFMSIDPAHLIRIVESRSGSVRCHLDLVMRFDHGITIPWVTRLHRGHGIHAVSGPDQLVIRADVPLNARGMSTTADFTVTAGQKISFILSHAPSHHPMPEPPDPAAALRKTEAWWHSWSHRTAYHGRWRAPVQRSLLTLKALTHAPTGGIAAAPTTSLPEQIGGTRNWDYRFCWPRDASFCLLALSHAGHHQEARAWADWLHRAVAGSPTQLQALYGLGGERYIPEQELPWLPGYENSKPVRIGNAAMAQHQLDVFGELELALHHEVEMGFAAPATHWGLRRALIDHLVTIWRDPDDGIWEVRGGRQQFTFSKAMAWAALDRAIAAAKTHGLQADLACWTAARDEVFAMIIDRGFNPAIGAFTQTLDGATLDASLLLLPLIGFLPATDPRVLSTTAAIAAGLMQNGLVRRYHTAQTADGLPPGEGVFLACSFWYVANLALQGRQTDAEAMFAHLLTLCNDVGLLSEEYDSVTKRQLGNFPQAFSHLALISAALILDGGETTL